MPPNACPRCSRPIQDEFRVCPYCAAPLNLRGAETPVVAAAEREGHRDLAAVNAALAVMAGFGALGCIAAIYVGTGYLQAWPGLAFCVVFVLSLLVGGRPGKALLHGLGATLGLGCVGVLVFALFIAAAFAAVGQVCSGLGK
jgi:hypothetical protein